MTVDRKSYCSDLKEHLMCMLIDVMLMQLLYRRSAEVFCDNEALRSLFMHVGLTH